MAKETFEEMTDEKQEKFKKNYLVKAPIARVVKKVDKSKGGRPYTKTPRQMLLGINSYFEWCENNDRTPSMKGLMLHLKMNKTTFYRYSENEMFMELIEQARVVMQEWLENDIYRTPGQAAGKIAYMKNIHNWADKIDTTSINENRNTTILSVEDAKAKIASLAHLINPELLEAVAGRYVNKQLVHVEAEVTE